jgi:ATP-dependent helicase/nuclease subunit B
MTGVSVWTIPPGLSFADVLVTGIAAEAAAAGVPLTRVQILLPTRRACRAVAAAFLRLADGRALLLPRMRPLGDLDDDEDEPPAGEDEAIDTFAVPPAVAPLRRQLLLTRLVAAMGAAETTPDQAARLARELARLLDQVQTERLDLRALETLVPAALAEHWQVTLRFLEILTEHWPQILAEEGCIDPAERRNRLLEAQAHAWRCRPPTAPVYAAGSTGSVPATAALLEVVARLPNGSVILPGLDGLADDTTWAAILDDPGHPQFGMAHLLARLEIDRRRVPVWPAAAAREERSARVALVNRALRPAATVDAPISAIEAPLADLGGVTRIDCPGPEEEARCIALILRHTLETPHRTAALVTPNRVLARRVTAELRRWDIEIDDSAGQPLAVTPPGVFLRLIARMVAEAFAPVPTLPALKHPLAGLGLGPAVCRSRVRRLERLALRGPRPAAGIEGLRAAIGDGLPDREPDVEAFVEALVAATAPLRALFARPRAGLRALVVAHVETAEALAATDRRTGADRLWTGDAGEALACHLEQLAEAADAIDPLAPGDYPALFDVLMTGQVVRPGFGRHPRLAIWGPLEARLQHADVMILGGLNEDGWPPKVAPSPWMSRPMMKTFGLPLPERRIGLSAHDFTQAIAAPVVYLTRAEREEGAPTVPCRWLLRLGLFTRGTPWEEMNVAEAARWLGWQRQLDAPTAADRVRITPPAPTPPVAARPRRLSVTRVETWMRDPYAIYARYVLDLRALDPIDADPTAAEYGAAVHQALHAFIDAHPRHLPADALDALLAAGERAFARLKDRPGVRAFWWPRFRRIAAWFVAVERQRRAGLTATATEIAGRIVLDAPAGPFELTATADRIDLLADGTLALVDYKTGVVPTDRDVTLGLAPQLPLEAVIAQDAGFLGIDGRPVSAIEYWQLTGGHPPGRRQTVAREPERLIETARAGLAHLIASFDRPETPYLARPRPAAATRYNDYAHLARIKEWSAADDGGP